MKQAFRAAGLEKVGRSEGKRVGWLQEQAACNSDYLDKNEETPSTYGRGKEFQHDEGVLEIQGEGAYCVCLRCTETIQLINNPKAGLLRRGAHRNDVQPPTPNLTSRKTILNCFARQSPLERGKAAFTLAEVLITLGIIGVVAAMTLPTLVNNYQKKVLHTQFLKTLSDLNNASKLFEVHEGQTVQDFSKNQSYNYQSTHILRQFLKYYKGTKEIGLNNTQAFQKLGYRPKPLSGQEITTHPCDESSAIQEVGGSVFIMDNALVSVDTSVDYSSVQIGPKICVDTNGKKGPNTYGYDWFVFAFTNKGMVIPYIGSSLVGYGPDLANPSTYCNYTQTQATYTCAYYAISDTSPLDPSKSYWKDFLK